MPQFPHLQVETIELQDAKEPCARGGPGLNFTSLSPWGGGMEKVLGDRVMGKGETQGEKCKTEITGERAQTQDSSVQTSPAGDQV